MSDETAPVRGIADFPEDISSLEAKAVEGLKNKILKDFERLDARENLSADDMEHLAALNAQLKVVRADEAARAEKKAETDSLREQIRREMQGEAETVEEAVDGATEGAEVIEIGDAGQAEATGADVAPVVEAIAASVAQRLAVRTAPRPVPSTKVQRRDAAGVTIIASSDTPGISTGSHLTGDQLSEAIHKRARAMGVTTGTGSKALIASVEKTNPRNDIRNLRNDNDIMRVWNEAHNSDALVASGGWCSPSETIYDFACDFEAMPDVVDLPTMTASRGGVRYPESVNLADFLSTSGIGMEWTEADDIAAATAGGPVKVCASVPCPTFDEVRLEAFYTCLKAGNLVDRSFPELVNRSRDLALTAHAHRLNAARIAKMVAASTVLNPVFSAGLSATESVLGALEFELARFRDAFFTSMDFTLEAVAPRWLKSLIRRDIARRAGVDFRQVSDADISAYFTEIGIRIQFVSGYQPLAASATSYPANVEIMFYPAGAFTLLDGGQLDIAVIRDSVLNATNDHTLLFFEEFWALLNRCGAFRMTIPVCANGSTGAPEQIVCPSV